MDNQAENLLVEWYRWWCDTDEAPPKMPNALHVRTAITLLRLGRLDDDGEVMGGVNHGAPEYHYAEVMDCGHFMEVIMFVPMPDRSVLSDLDLCHLCKEEGKDYLRRVASWRLMEPRDWQGTATPCPDGRCGPVEDASDYPEAFPMLGIAPIAPYQLGRCARCGQYYQWDIESQRWDPWREEV